MPQRRRLITGVALCVTVMAAASIDTTALAQADRDSAAPRGAQGRSRVAVRGDQCSRPDRPGAAQYQPSSRGRQYWIWQSPVAHEFSTAEGRASNHGRAGISIWTGGHLRSKVSTAVACNGDRDCAASDRSPSGLAHGAGLPRICRRPHYAGRSHVSDRLRPEVIQAR